MAVIYYASNNEFKIHQRRGLAQLRNWSTEPVKGVVVGKRVTMFKSIEEVVSLKWQLASRARAKGQILMVDGIDISIDGEVPFYKQYQQGVVQEEYVDKLLSRVQDEKEWPKVILKSAVAIGVVGGEMGMFVGLLEGNLFYRPKMAWDAKLPKILPYIYVMYWQKMLASVYAMDFQDRLTYVTHDQSSFVQALMWMEEKLVLNKDLGDNNK